MPAAEQIICPACSRKYPYRPDLAGKTVKCKCGQAILIAAPEAEDYEDEEEEIAPANDDFAAVAQAAESSIPDTGYRCPGCRQPLNPGTHVCDNCGFNLRTGVKPSARPAAAAGALSASKGFNIKTPGGNRPKLALKSGAARKPGGGMAGKKSSSFQMSPVLIIGIVAFIGAGAYYGMQYFGGDGSGGSAKTAKAALGDDAQVAEKMADELPMEAREWLDKDPDRHKLGTGWNTKQAKGKLDDLYNMGAVKIYAFGGGLCLAFAIELPSDKDKRAELFKWENKWHEEMNEKPATDVGQKYLLVVAPK